MDLAAAALALARAFAAGATMWCVAPQWPEHARHVAVEFVHPVIMGKRALPAVAVDGPDAVAALRAVAGRATCSSRWVTATTPSIVDAAAPAPAWGLTSVWIGSRPRPDAGARRPRRCGSTTAAATRAHDGRLVLLYHVLWELTHVCFEHPGLVASHPTSATTSDCITCSDEGRLGEVVAVPTAVRCDGAHGAAASRRSTPRWSAPVAARRPRARPRRHRHRRRGG